MQEILDGLERAVAKWDEMGWPRPEVVVVSGSGLAVDLGTPEHTLPLSEWLSFDAHEVAGHPHQTELLLPRPDRPVLYQKGRLHSYQGYSAHQTVFAIRLGALLGARVLVMTNAAGGLRPDQTPGDLVLIRDHLNLIGLNPLRGQLPEEWGPRFPDLSQAYDPELRELAKSVGERLGIELSEGVYAGVAGPSYETSAEVRMLRTLGADLVGMSTVLEVIAAKQMGLRCLCLSLVTNLGTGVVDKPMDHEDVLTMSRASAGKIERLLTALLEAEALTRS
jgi:purine-nucleoside phosphorylase